MRGHPERSWSVWAELGGLTVVPIVAGLTVGYALQTSFSFLQAAILLMRVG